MASIDLDLDVAKIIGRLDRSNPDALLTSFAKEFLRLHSAYLTLQSRVSALEVTQTIIDRVAATAPTAVALPRSVTIDAAFSLSPEAGFHFVEYDQRGNPYRWTGPETTFYFELLVDRQTNASLQLRYSQLYADVFDQEVRCFVDGTEIEIETVSIDDEFELHGVLPVRDTSGGSVVMFVCPLTQSPAEREYTNDTRKLGLAFRWLKIEPGAVVVAAEPAVEAPQAPEAAPAVAPAAVAVTPAPAPEVVEPIAAAVDEFERIFDAEPSGEPEAPVDAPSGRKSRTVSRKQ